MAFVHNSGILIVGSRLSGRSAELNHFGIYIWQERLRWACPYHNKNNLASKTFLIFSVRFLRNLCVSVDKPKGAKRLSLDRYKTLHHKLSPSTTGDWHHAMENKPVSGPRPHMMRVMLIQNVAVDQRFANGASPASLPPQAYTPSRSLVFPSLPSFVLQITTSHGTQAALRPSLHITLSYPISPPWNTRKVIALESRSNDE